MGQRGFTLMEVIVALAVGSLLIAMTSASVATNRKRWDETNSLYEATIFKTRLETLLVEKLESAVAFDPIAVGDFFVGQPNQLSFLAPAPLVMPGIGIARYRLMIGRHSDGQFGLIMDVAQNLTGAEPMISELLAPNVTNLEISYGDPSNGGLQFAPNWAFSDRLPALVKIQITTDDQTPRVLIFTAQTKANLDSRCLFDPVSRSCRI
ncbi:MAG: prepilin-type N-terminal cleavage/methylation domain-containing protein [Sphingomonadales bacterium]